MRMRSLLFFLVVLITACGGGSTEPSAPPPVPVASILIDPASVSLTPGGTRTLTATTRDATGGVLPGRAITWTSANASVATVSTSGTVTAVAPGATTVTAASEGRSATVTVTVLSPVTSVTISGDLSPKVGDSYTYTATARTADGNIAVRPISWSVTDPTKAQMNTNGAMVPLAAGAITLRATIDGAPWIIVATAYDWEPFGSGTTLGLSLAADVAITNRFGQSELPTLLVGCTSGQMVIAVRTERFITASGLVAYSFDGGTIFTRTWVESTDFRSLIFPSLSNQVTTAFTGQLSTARTFEFAFGEFQSSARATQFRVTGLASRLGTMLPGCQLLNNRIASNPTAEQLEALFEAAGRPINVDAPAQQRRDQPSQQVRPSLKAPVKPLDRRAGIRVAP